MQFQTIVQKICLAGLVNFAAASATLAQQGMLDTTFGTNNSGIYQESLPAPTPAGATSGYINSYYNSGDAYADGRVIVSGGISSSTSNGIPIRKWIAKI